MAVKNQASDQWACGLQFANPDLYKEICELYTLTEFLSAYFFQCSLKKSPWFYIHFTHRKTPRLTVNIKKQWLYNDF